MLQFRTPSSGTPRSRCPSGARADVAEGRLRTLGSPLSRPAAAGARAVLRLRTLGTGILELHRQLDARFRRPFCSSSRCSRSRPGASSSTSCGRSGALARTVDAVPRRLPPQQQVLGSAGGLPIARRQPARRPVSGRLRRADRAAASDGARTRRTGPIHAPPAGRPTLKSLTAVDRALLRASVVEVNKLENACRFWRRRRASRRSSGCSARCGAS